MIRNLTIILLLFIILFSSTSCDNLLNVDVVGDGNLKSEIRNRPVFSSVSLDSDFEVVLMNGAKQEIKVETDSNLLSYILTDVNDGQLDISGKPNFIITPRQPVRIYLSVSSSFVAAEVINGGTIIADSLIVADFDANVFGVSSFSGENIDCKRFSVFSEGSTSINLHGEFDVLSIRQKGSGNMMLQGYGTFGNILLEGSGKIDARSMTLGDADISLYGSGLVLCDVLGRLNAKIDGNGRIYYYGEPDELLRDITGDGMVLLGN